MNKTIISVRDVDEETFTKFRSMSIEERMKLGDALTKAMKILLLEMKKNQLTQKIPQVKPFSWGRETKNLSNEVDKIIYK